MPDAFDFAVVGGGMAGASMASELASDARVILLEAEDQPGYHTTGRSAALYSEIYGSAAIRALTVASGAFFRSPPAGFAPHALTVPRGVLVFATKAQGDALSADFETYRRLVPDLRYLDAGQVGALAPVLRPESAELGIYEPRAVGLDVHAVLHGYLARFRARGGTVATASRITALARAGAQWTITTTRNTVSAAVLVNAAGAWADPLAELADAAPLGIVPCRRTAITFDVAGRDVGHLPLMLDHDESFYMLPEGSGMLASPADETPSPPTDAQPEDLDIALAAHLVEIFSVLSVPRIRSSWAGLRSFSPDRSPVVGFDCLVPGLFWLAGQGGYGIQTAPALSRVAAAWARGRPTPADVADTGFIDTSIQASRFSSRIGRQATPATSQ